MKLVNHVLEDTLLHELVIKMCPKPLVFVATVTLLCSIYLAFYLPLTGMPVEDLPNQWYDGNGNDFIVAQFPESKFYLYRSSFCLYSNDPHINQTFPNENTVLNISRDTSLAEFCFTKVVSSQPLGESMKNISFT